MIYKVKLPALEGFGDGDATAPWVRVPILGRGIIGITGQVVGTTEVPDTINHVNVIDRIIVEADGRQEKVFDATIKRAVDNIDNMNDDTLSIDFFSIPFLRPGAPWSAWGTSDIGQLLLKFQLKALPDPGYDFTGIDLWMHYVDLIAPRGDTFIESIIRTKPTRGDDWNEFPNIPLPDIRRVSRLYANHTRITDVQVLLGKKIVYESSKASALFDLQNGPWYKGDGAPDGFPIMLDAAGPSMVDDMLDLIEPATGQKQDVTLRYKWNGNAATLADVDIYCQGVKVANPQARPVAKA
jgi:hypothetical protein